MHLALDFTDCNAPKYMPRWIRKTSKTAARNQWEHPWAPDDQDFWKKIESAKSDMKMSRVECLWHAMRYCFQDWLERDSDDFPPPRLEVEEDKRQPRWDAFKNHFKNERNQVTYDEQDISFELPSDSSIPDSILESPECNSTEEVGNGRCIDGYGTSHLYTDGVVYA